MFFDSRREKEDSIRGFSPHNIKTRPGMDEKMHPDSRRLSDRVKKLF